MLSAHTLLTAILVVLAPAPAAAYAIHAFVTDYGVGEPTHLDSGAADFVRISFFAELTGKEMLTVGELHVFLRGSTPTAGLVGLGTVGADTTTTSQTGWRQVGHSISPVGSSQPGFDEEAILGALTIRGEVVVSGSFLDTTTITREAWNSLDGPVHLGDLELVSLGGGENGFVTLDWFNDGDPFVLDPDESRLHTNNGFTLVFVQPGGEFGCISVGNGACAHAGPPVAPEPGAALLFGCGALVLSRALRRGRLGPC